MRLFYSLFMGAMAIGATLQARPLSDPPKTDPALVGLNKYASTAISNLKSLSVKKYAGNECIFNLPDGTRTGGLLFYDSQKGKRPLIIATFGLMADRWDSPVSGFVQDIWEKGLLPANLLVLDHPSSAGFYALNNELSLGGYDEGRIFNQVATLLFEPKLDCVSVSSVEFSSLHLMGISLGGVGVMHALVQDSQREKPLFASAITFSGVIDQETMAAAFMKKFGHPLSITSKKSLSFGDKIITLEEWNHFESIMTAMKGDTFSLPSKKIGDLFYDKFLARLQRLSQLGAAKIGWNKNVSMDGVESYLTSSDAVLDHQYMESLKAPLIMIQAKDDPIVSASEFKIFAAREYENTQILTYEVRHGGHWGFGSVYGYDWITDLVKRALQGN